MDSCCENKAGELAQLRERRASVLHTVLAINGLMFVVEFIAGWMIGSTALLGDSLDMFGDAAVYALTLYTLHRSVRGALARRRDRPDYRRAFPAFRMAGAG